MKIETLLYFRRLLHENPFILTFGEENLSEHTEAPDREARNRIDQLKNILHKININLKK